MPRIGWAEVDGTAYYFAHSYAAETPRATAWSEGIVAEARSGSFLGVQFHPEKSGAAGARYLDRVLAGGAGAIPLPRLIPCLDVAAGRVVKGVQVPGAARRRRPGRARRGVLRPRRRRARLPRREGDARGARHARRRRAPRRRAARDPVHGRRRHPHGRRRRRSCCRAGADKVSVNSAALAGPSLITELAEKLGSQAVVVAIDTEGGRVRTRAGTTETARETVEWAREAAGARRRGDPADVDRRRRHARGLRPRDHARRSPTRCRCR